MTLSSRFQGLAALLVLLTAGLIGFIVFRGYAKISRQIEVSEVQRSLLSKEAALRAAIRELDRSVATLANLHDLVELGELHSHIDPERNDTLYTRTVEVFESLAAAHPSYYQIRLLSSDSTACELVRIERSSDGMRRVPDQELQAKESRYYVRELLRLREDSSYFSEIDLNWEHGQVEVPHRPTLRVGRLVHEEGAFPVGMVVINVDWSIILEESIPSAGARPFYIANTAGDYLAHPDPERTFGFDLGRRYTVQNEFGVPLPTNVSPQRPQIFTASPGSSASGLLVGLSLARVFPDPGRFLVLGETGSRNAAADVKTLRSEALAFTGLMIALALGSASILVRWMLRPVMEITGTAAELAMGKKQVELPSHRKDEIGTMARALRAMVQKLLEREEAALIANVRLTQANEDLEHFSHVASHDLREPARRLGALADLVRLEAGDAVSEETHELLGEMQHQADHMLDQISDLRAMVDLGSGHLTREVVDLGVVLQEVMALFSQQAISRGAVVTMPKPLQVLAYKNLLPILFTNLVANAFEFSGAAPFQLRFDWEQSESETIFGVWNSGSAIPGSKVKSVLKPFVRLTSSSGGRGMGLSACRKIVERHAGRIWVESGTDFVHVRFTLGGVT